MKTAHSGKSRMFALGMIFVGTGVLILFFSKDRPKRHELVFTFDRTGSVNATLDDISIPTHGLPDKSGPPLFRKPINGDFHVLVRAPAELTFGKLQINPGWVNLLYSAKSCLFTLELTDEKGAVSTRNRTFVNSSRLPIPDLVESTGHGTWNDDETSTAELAKLWQNKDAQALWVIVAFHPDDTMRTWIDVLDAIAKLPFENIHWDLTREDSDKPNPQGAIFIAWPDSSSEQKTPSRQPRPQPLTPFVAHPAHESPAKAPR